MEARPNIRQQVIPTLTNTDSPCPASCRHPRLKMRVKSKMCMIGHRAAGRSRTASLGISLGWWRSSLCGCGCGLTNIVSLELAQQSLCFALRQPPSDHCLRHLLLGLAIKLVAFGELTAMRVLAEMTLYSRRVPPMMGGST